MENKDERLIDVGGYAEMEVGIFKQRLKSHKEKEDFSKCEEDFSECMDKCVEYMKMIQGIKDHNIRHMLAEMPRMFIDGRNITPLLYVKDEFIKASNLNVNVRNMRYFTVDGIDALLFSDFGIKGYMYKKDASGKPVHSNVFVTAKCPLFIKDSEGKLTGELIVYWKVDKEKHFSVNRERITVAVADIIENNDLRFAVGTKEALMTDTGILPYIEYAEEVKGHDWEWLIGADSEEITKIFEKYDTVGKAINSSKEEPVSD